MNTIDNPFVAFFPPFAIGIIFSYSIDFTIPYAIAILLLLLLIALFFHKHNKQLLFGIFLYVFLFFLGINITQTKRPVAPTVNTEQKLAYTGVIVEPIKEKRKTVQAIIKLEAYKDSTSWKPLKTKALVLFEKNKISKSFEYGDRIIFKGYLNEIQNTGNPEEFKYKEFMQNKGVFVSAFVKGNSFLRLEKGQANWIVRKALELRTKMLETYQYYGFQDQQYAVLSALSLGYRDEIDNETRQMFANTGAMHILAVSGLHVGIIYLILITLLKFMDKKDWLKILKGIIIILSLWLFATIAGLSPSVRRSALMFSLFVVGKFLNRSAVTYNIIFASAFILLFINPLDILSVGFQLSYSAVLAIVTFQPHINKIFSFKQVLPDKIWDLTSVSIAAQLGTMPISIYYFHQFPNYFFITNIFVIPLASIILYLAVALLVLHYTLTFVATFFAYTLKLSLKILLTIVGLINQIPYSTTTDIYISASQNIILYVVIIGLLLFWIKNNVNFLYVLLVSFAIFLLINFDIKYKNSISNELVIFNNYKQLTISVLDGKSNYILTDTTNTKSLEYLTKAYRIKKQADEPQVLDLKTFMETKRETELFVFNKNFFSVGNTTFAIINDNNFLKNTTKKKLKVDYVILSDNVYADIEELAQLFEFQMIIFAGNNKIWRVEKWEKQCENLKIPYHNILSQGAFEVDFETKELLNI